MEAELKAISEELMSAAAAADLAQISYAAELECLSAGATRSRLEHLGHKLCLRPAIIRWTLDDWSRRAGLMRAGHLFIERLRTA
jgi:hypothetical protein